MTETLELHVTGMSCEHCARAITQAIRAGDPGAEVRVDLAAGTVRATTGMKREEVEAAIQEEGYSVAG